MNAKLLVSLGFVISLGAGALTVATVWDARETALDQARIAAENLSHAVETGISRTFETYALSLEGARDALGNPQVQQMPPDVQRLVIFDRATEASNLGSVLVLDADGHVLVDSKQSPPRTANLGDRDYFLKQKAADAGLYISAPFVSRIDGAWSVALSRRINKADGGFGGIVVGTIKLDYLRNLFSSLSAGRKGTVSLFHSDGTLIMRTPYSESELGRNYANVGVFQQLRKARAGTFDQVAVRDGVARRYVYGQIGRLPLVFSIGLAFDDILQDWTRKAIVIGLFASLLYGALIALCVLLDVELRRRRAAERRALAHASRFINLAEKASDAIVLRDAGGVRKYASARFYDFIGRTPEEVGATPLAAYLHPDTRAIPAKSMLKLIRGEAQVSENLQVIRPDGETIWLEALSTAVRDGRGHLREVITTMRDVTEQRMQTERMLEEHKALEVAVNVDPLTGVYNRRFFDTALTRETQQAARAGLPLSVVMIDVDHFKTYNDHLGHPAGDAALVNVAASLRTGARRNGDLLARYGGEEFVLLLPNTTHEAALMIGEDIRRAVRARGLPHPSQPTITISVGVATSTQGEAAQLLVQMADRALYRAKADGRDCVRSVQHSVFPLAGADGGDRSFAA